MSSWDKKSCLVVKFGRDMNIFFTYISNITLSFFLVIVELLWQSVIVGLSIWVLRNRVRFVYSLGTAGSEKLECITEEKSWNHASFCIFFLICYFLLFPL